MDIQCDDHNRKRPKEETEYGETTTITTDTVGCAEAGPGERSLASPFPLNDVGGLIADVVVEELSQMFGLGDERGRRLCANRPARAKHQVNQWMRVAAQTQ